MCMYRSCSRNKDPAANQRFIDEIGKLNDEVNGRNVIIAGDVTSPTVNWCTGCVNSAMDTHNKFFVLQQQFMDCIVLSDYS